MAQWRKMTSSHAFMLLPGSNRSRAAQARRMVSCTRSSAWLTSCVKESAKARRLGTSASIVSRTADFAVTLHPSWLTAEADNIGPSTLRPKGERLALLLGGGAQVGGGDDGAHAARGGEGLQARHARAHHEDARRRHRARR